MHSPASANLTSTSLSPLLSLFSNRLVDNLIKRQRQHTPFSFPLKPPISASQMASSTPKFSYQRLRHEGGFSDDEDHDLRERVIGKVKSWPKTRKVHIKKRVRVRSPSLRRFLKRKARAILVTWTKIVKRLKESQEHLGDLFAGNYLFFQVTPTPLKNHHHELHGLSSRYSVPRITQ